MAALHEWIKKRLIKPQACRDCNQPKPLDLANISGEYRRELSDWEWLCRSCHMKKDGRTERLLAIPKRVRKGEEHHFYGKPELNPMLGKHHTVETRQKISNSLRGNIPWNKGMKGGNRG